MRLTTAQTAMRPCSSVPSCSMRSKASRQGSRSPVAKPSSFRNAPGDQVQCQCRWACFDNATANGCRMTRTFATSGKSTAPTRPEAKTSLTSNFLTDAGLRSRLSLSVLRVMCRPENTCPNQFCQSASPGPGQGWSRPEWCFGKNNGCTGSKTSRMVRSAFIREASQVVPLRPEPTIQPTAVGLGRNG
jgi:hypothetical protein